MSKTDKKSEFPTKGKSRSQSETTGRYRTEKTLRETENFIRHVVELSPVVLVLYDLATEHYTYFSSNALKVYGYTGDEIMQMPDPFAMLMQPEDIPRIRENVNGLKLLGDGEINEFECRIRRGDGEQRWINARSMIFARDENGEARQIISATFDVTERKEAEKKLIESEKLFRSYFELGLIGMAITSPTKGSLAVNNELCKILGYERDELLSRNWAEITHPEDLAADVANFNRVMAGEIDDYRLEKRWIRKSGRIIDTIISAKCVRRDDGSVDYFVALVEDVTARKQLDNERQKFVSLAENSSEFIGICDLDYVPVYINEAGAKMVGLESPEQAKKLLVRDFFFEEDRDLVVGEFFNRVLREGEGELEVHMRHFKTGEPLWMIFMAFIVKNTGGETIGLGTVSRNMTERKRLEDTLRESEENYRVIVNQAVAGIFKLDLDGNVTFSNQRFCEMLAYSREELLEMSTENIVYAEDLPRNNWLFERLKNQGLSYEIEKRLVRKGGSVIWVNNQISPVFDSAGNPKSVVVVSVDITERRQAGEALRQMNDELEDRVTQRTEQLSDLNEELKKEIKERERVEADRERLLRRIVSAQEEERQRIAREMHDQLGQNLSALALKLSALKNDYDTQPEISEHFASLKKIVTQLDADVGFLVRDLRPTALDDFGLVVALSNYVRNWSKQFGVSAELHTRGMEKDRLEGEVETVLYRITQEALTNVAKHANAENVDILLERRSDSVSLIVEDDGDGFDVEEAFGASKKGFGLIGMRERAALVEGTLAVESTPDAGATIRVKIPAEHISNGGVQNG